MDERRPTEIRLENALIKATLDWVEYERRVIARQNRRPDSACGAEFSMSWLIDSIKETSEATSAKIDLFRAAGELLRYKADRDVQ
jgi:hypothetical protein